MRDVRSPMTTAPARGRVTVVLGSTVRVRDTDEGHEHTVVGRITVGAPAGMRLRRILLGTAVLGRRPATRWTSTPTLRVSVIQICEHQNVDGAVAELRALGVRHVGKDRLREIRRGVREMGTGPAELCGRCADGKLAVLPTGDVVPCLLSRWVVLGNVRTTCIGDLYERSHEARTALVAATRAGGKDATRGIHKCGPDGDGGVCEQPTCLPYYEEAR